MRALVLVALVLSSCVAPAAHPPPAGAPCWPLVVAATGRVEPATGGVVALAWAEGSRVKATVPASALPSFDLEVVVADVGDAFMVSFNPDDVVLERPLALRVGVGPGDVVWRARDGSVVEGEPVPGAVVIAVNDLGEVFEVTRGREP